jgi:chromosome partitioning protein
MNVDRVNGREQVGKIIGKCELLLEVLEKNAANPNDNIVFDRKFSISEVEGLCGRGRQSIYLAEKQHGIAGLERSAGGRTVGCSLDQVNAFRRFFGTMPTRKPGDPCLKIAVQSFKGGVAKTTTSVHFAKYLAIRGYRVLLVDFDAQASATLSMGFNPDRDFTLKDTLQPYLTSPVEKRAGLDYCIKSTGFPGVSIIPSCLQFYEAEYTLAHRAAISRNENERTGYFVEFVEAFCSVEDRFDVIIFDSPPALGMITINILNAADALIVPTPPALYDVSSTLQYFKMIKSVFDDIAPGKQYDFIKILITRADLRKTKNIDFINMMKDVFAGNIFQNIFRSTAAIDTSTAEFKSVYETGDKKAAALLDKVFREIELEMLKCWPSKVKVLEEEGIV